MDNGQNHLREFGKFRLDTEKRVLSFEGKPINLPPKEIDVLSVLLENVGEVVTKSELMERVWPDAFVEESNLSRHIYKLRQTFTSHGLDGGLIQTVPTRGYRFNPENECEESNEYRIERHLVSRTLIENVHAANETEIQTHSFASRDRFILKCALIGVVAASLVAIASALLTESDVIAHETPIRSIAVLPFREIEPDGSNSHRGIGIADLLITRLSNIKEISVRPTNSILGYGPNNSDLDQIRENLQVDGIVEGTVMRVGDQIRVTARLVRLSDKASIWSAQFERNLQNESSLQNELAMQIVDALAINLSGASRSALTKRYTDSADAMQLYQLGRYHWNKRNNEGLIEAQRLFRNAVNADPNFALAYVGIADSQIFEPSVDEAVTAVEKALELDSNLGEAFATRGFINMFHRWDWNAAEADFQKAIEINPGHSSAHQWYATLLMIKRRPVEARARLKDALKINPMSYNLLGDLCQAEYYARNLAAAEKTCRSALELYPDFQYARGWLSRIYFESGRAADGITEMALQSQSLSSQANQSEEHREASRNATTASIEKYLSAYRTNGPNGYWRLIQSETVGMGTKDAGLNILLARAHLELGEHDVALGYLSTAVEFKAFLAPLLNGDPIWEPLRSDPRFQSLIAKMGLSN